MSKPRLTLHIDRLRVAGAVPGDAAALAEGLRTALQSQLAGQMAQGPIAAQTVPQMSLRLPPTAGHGAAAVGRQAGHQIAVAIARPKGGR